GLNGLANVRHGNVESRPVAHARQPIAQVAADSFQSVCSPRRCDQERPVNADRIKFGGDARN
ncbi:MAG TPA: hypothetical protein PKW63_01180, partial [Vicinamibacterales bacterium]|nr:hypothetical protein [Vicinamibacterales bacterium]